MILTVLGNNKSEMMLRQAPGTVSTYNMGGEKNPQV